MKKVLRALGPAALVAAFMTVPALAAEMDFTTVDADASGSVTLEEATAAGWEWTEEQFSAADADGDGALSMEEFAKATAG